MANRRNYYRILYVQPEAPTAIIQASYRTLMTTLAQHPKLGGDPEAAALINKAYATLNDPDKRKAYDKTLNIASLRSNNKALHLDNSEDHSTASIEHNQCLFCGTVIAQNTTPDTRCPSCNSPIKRTEMQSISKEQQIFDRRRIPRVLKSDPVKVFPNWPHPGIESRIRDLSPEGINFETDIEFIPKQILKITGASFDSIARIISIKRDHSLHSVHAEFLTVAFQNLGSFLSTNA